MNHRFVYQQEGELDLLKFEDNMEERESHREFPSLKNQNQTKHICSKYSYEKWHVVFPLIPKRVIVDKKYLIVYFSFMLHKF